MTALGVPLKGGLAHHDHTLLAFIVDQLAKASGSARTFQRM